MNFFKQCVVMLLLVVIVLVPFTAFSEVTCTIVKNPDKTLTRIFYSHGKEIARAVEDRNGGIIKTVGKIPDGVAKEYYKGGKLSADYNYRDGKLGGITKFYYEDGKMRGESNYYNGTLEGKTRYYYTTGALSGEWNYKNGKLEGMTTLYWGNGKIKAQRSFEDGKQDGVSKKYYDSGKLQYEEAYVDGRIISKKEYNKAGVVILNQNYQIDRERKAK